MGGGSEGESVTEKCPLTLIGVLRCRTSQVPRPTLSFPKSQNAHCTAPSPATTAPLPFFVAAPNLAALISLHVPRRAQLPPAAALHVNDDVDGPSGIQVEILSDDAHAFAVTPSLARRLVEYPRLSKPGR